jgi:hypothetical protein
VHQSERLVRPDLVAHATDLGEPDCMVDRMRRMTSPTPELDHHQT